MNRFFENLPYENSFSYTPSVDIFEKNDHIIIKADIPGIEPHNMEISVSENQVNIKGKIEENNEIKEEHFHHIERRFGSFNRTLTLPAKVDHKKAVANSNNGVLEIKIPKLTNELNKTTRLKLE